MATCKLLTFWNRLTPMWSRRCSATPPESSGRWFLRSGWSRPRRDLDPTLRWNPGFRQTVPRDGHSEPVSRPRRLHLDDSPLGDLHFRRAIFHLDAELGGL